MMVRTQPTAVKGGLSKPLAGPHNGRVMTTVEKETPMAKPTETTDATFKDEVLDNELPTLVDFWAPWCGPCRMVAPVVEELAEEYEGKVSFYKLNTDDNPQVASTYGIRSIPTLLVFKGGEPVGQIVGFRPKGDLKKRLDEVLG